MRLFQTLKKYRLCLKLFVRRGYNKENSRLCVTDKNKRPYCQNVLTNGVYLTNMKKGKRSFCLLNDPTSVKYEIFDCTAKY